MYRVLWAGAVLLGLLVLAMITGFEPLYWLFYVVAGGAIVGYLWAWIQSRGLETQIQEITSHPEVGQPIQIKVLVRERVGLPRLGIRARVAGDLSTEAGEELSLLPKGTSTWWVAGLCKRRGPSTVGPLAIASADPSGLLRLECRTGEEQSVLVYPATVDLSAVAAEGQATGGEMAETGQYLGHSPAATMVRQYVPGDSLTHIHWPTTARRDQLMTKQFEGAGIGEIWLFLGLREEDQVGTGAESTEEYSITIAASLLKSLTAVGHAVGLVMQGDQLYRMPPRKDPNYLWALLRGLALVKATGNAPMSTLIRREGENLGPGSVAIVVAPWPNEGMGTALQFLRRQGIPTVPILLDSFSFGKTGDPRWFGEGLAEIRDWAVVIRKGDDLALPLGNVMQRIAAY